MMKLWLTFVVGDTTDATKIEILSEFKVKVKEIYASYLC